MQETRSEDEYLRNFMLYFIINSSKNICYLVTLNERTLFRDCAVCMSKKRRKSVIQKVGGGIGYSLRRVNGGGGTHVGYPTYKIRPRYA